MTTKRLGRPPKPPTEKQGCRITVNATLEQRAAWAERAAFEAMSLSAWLAYRADCGDGGTHERGYRDGVKDSAARVLELLKGELVYAHDDETPWDHQRLRVGMPAHARDPRPSPTETVTYHAHPRLRLPEELEPAPAPEPAHPKQLCSNCKRGLALSVSMLCDRCESEPEEPYMVEATNEPRRAPGSWALVSTRSGWVCGLVERTGDIIDARDGRRYQAIGLRDIGSRVCALHVEGGCADPAPAEPKTSLPVLAGHHGSLSAVADPGLPPGRARISQEEP